MDKKFTHQDYEFARDAIEKTARELVTVMRHDTVGFEHWARRIRAPLIRLASDLAYAETIRNSKSSQPG